MPNQIGDRRSEKKRVGNVATKHIAPRQKEARTNPNESNK